MQSWVREARDGVPAPPTENIPVAQQRADGSHSHRGRPEGALCVLYLAAYKSFFTLSLSYPDVCGR